MILAERSARHQAEALVSAANLEIERLKLLLAKARREQFGQTSERGKRLIDQLELQLAELEETAAEDEAAVEAARAKAGTIVAAHVRIKPARRPLPEHLPRERVIVPPPETCRCCGGSRLAKIGEAVTETLDVVPRRWFVRQTVREKFTCRDCETISEPPAPFHVIPRARIGASLLAMILFEKYGTHQPLNRQSERYAREGVDLDLSTMADHVGAGAAVLAPLHELIRGHVLAAERLHGDDTTVPVLAKGKTITGRLWAYVRDDRPFAQGPPAVLFHYSRDRRGEHPQRHLAGYAGILQADAYGGFAGLYTPTRTGGAVSEALCWAHARRKFFELADLARAGKAPPAPLAVEAVGQIDAIFAHERVINGRPAADRRDYRREHAAPLVRDLEAWMKSERVKLSRHADVARAMDYMLKRWPAFTRFLDDGRICLTNNAAERALRGVALGRKSWLFVGSDRGGVRAASMYTLIGTAKLNDIDPQAWLADVLARIADHPISRLHQLLPWNWCSPAASPSRSAA
ncbi:MAG TPA: IS66 family transposase [Reyranella sp.]|nr:IS66 family transposase [Reyranella sp.]